MVLAVLRIPIPFSCGLAGIICMVLGDIPLAIIPAKVFNSVDSFAFLAIPAFIYSGDVMALGGITTALIAWVRSLTGRLKGSIAATTVITSALFGTISGSSVATVSAIGGMMLPEMVKAGYDKKYATALIAASGFLGILIPPSIPGVVYALAVGLPVGDVWLATAIPGVILTFFYCVYNRIFYAHQERQETGDFNARIYFQRIAKSSSRGIVALLMPVIIFVGVYGGIMTPTEAGAVAVGYGLIAGWIIYPFIFKDKAGEGLIMITKKSAVTSAAIMLLIAFAAIPSAMFTYGDCGHGRDGMALQHHGLAGPLSASGQRGPPHRRHVHGDEYEHPAFGPHHRPGGQGLRRGPHPLFRHHAPQSRDRHDHAALCLQHLRGLPPGRSEHGQDPLPDSRADLRLHARFADHNLCPPGVAVLQNHHGALII